MTRTILRSMTVGLAVVSVLGASTIGATAADGTCLAYAAPAGTPSETLEAAAATLAQRLVSGGLDGDVRADAGAGTIDVRLTEALTDAEGLRDLAVELGATGDVRFVPLPPGCVVDFSVDVTTPSCLEEATALLERPGILAAEVGVDEYTGDPIIHLQLDDDAARRFDAHANEHFGEFMALFVDDELVMAPSINARRYDGDLMVTGIFTPDEPDEARRLAATLQTGALPIELSLAVAGACELP